MTTMTTTITANIYKGVSIQRTADQLRSLMSRLRRVTQVEELEDAILLAFHRVPANDKKLHADVVALRDIRLCAAEGRSNVGVDELDALYEATEDEV